MEDLFDEILQLEEQAIAEGQQRGKLVAKQKALSDARELGHLYGERLGKHVGQVCGVVLAIRGHPERFNLTRANKTLVQLESMLQHFSLRENTSDSEQLWIKIDSKYRQLCSLLRLDGIEDSIGAEALSF